MRLNVNVDRLTEAQWKFAQDALRISYDIPMGASRVCLVLEHRGEERHTELPLGAFIGLMAGINVNDNVQAVIAALSPDEVPDHLEGQRNAADPQRAAERAEGPRYVNTGGPGYGAGTGYDAGHGDRLANGAYEK